MPGQRDEAQAVGAGSGRLGDGGAGLNGSQQAVDDSCEAAFKGSHGLHGGVAVASSSLVVDAAGAAEADLAQRDAMQRGVELAISTAGEPEIGRASCREEVSMSVVELG